MAEYIEREAAVKFARHAYNQWNLAMAAADGKREINLVYKRQELCKAVESVFADSPAADVAPVVHAKWVICSDGYYPYCSNCSEEPKGGLSSFCPHCGAKMDLEE